MASDAVFKWEIVRGINPLMVSDFLSSVFFSESELNLDGIIQRILDGEWDIQEFALSSFATENYSEFQDYIEEVTGDARSVSVNSKSAVSQFIEDRGLKDEYDSFYASNICNWREDKNIIREWLVSNKIGSLFSEMQRNSVYIYRDKDHWGIHVTRTYEA